MDLLRSSILGKEFVNYRKHTTENERRRFYKNATVYNKIPVVIDSVDEEFTNIFRKKSYINGMRIISYGLELEMDVGSSINDVIKEIKIELIKANKEHLFMENDIKLGLVNGTIITDEKEIVYNLYKKFRNINDNILYLLVTQEKTMYNYIMSIIRSIFGIFYKSK